MALVNPQIAMSYRPTVEYQPRNALAEYAQLQSIMGGQRQAEMADMQMDVLRRKERAISQIQATAAKNGGPTDRREIARAYINSGVPEFMQFGLTMDKDLDELDAFSRIMGGGAGGAARAAPSAAATAGANAMAAPAAAAPTMPALAAAEFTAPTKNEFAGTQSPEQRQRQIEGVQDTYRSQLQMADEISATNPAQAEFLRGQAQRTLDALTRDYGITLAQPPATANALAPAAAPVTNAMLAPAAQPAVPPADINQLASAGAAPAGAAPAGAAPPNSVAALRARRDQLIALGTPRALQAAKSLDADIALLSRTTAVAPGSTVIGPDGKEVYRAAAAPSSIATLEAEIASLKKAGAAENSLQVQSRRAAIQQASGQSTDLIRNYNAAVAAGFKGTIFEYERQIKQAGRAVTPPTPAAPVAVIDSATGNTIYVSREEALRNRMTPAGQGVSLTPKQIQTFEAKYPQATAAVKTFESKADRLAADLETLANHPGLSGISGLIYGRTPALTAEARQAEALYDSIIARGGFQELQDMRAASPTGGALGPVSNTENQYLRDAFSPIKRTQDTPDLKQALLGAAQATKDSKQRVREAYDLTYEYRARRGEGAAPAAPAAAAPAAPRVGEVRQGYRFKGGDPADQKNWEKQ